MLNILNRYYICIGFLLNRINKINPKETKLMLTKFLGALSVVGFGGKDTAWAQ